MSVDIADPLSALRALLPPERLERSRIMEKIRSRHFKTARDTTLRDAFDDMLELAVQRADPNQVDGVDNRREGRGIVLVGETGAGKTTALRRMFAEMFPGYRDPKSRVALFAVACPSPCNLKELGRHSLRALGYPIEGDPKTPIVWERVRAQIEGQQKLIFWIDEIQHIIRTSSDEEKAKILDTLKTLLMWPEWPLMLVLSGLPEIVTFLEKDDQVRRRLRFLRLDPMSADADGEMIADMLKSFAALAGATVPAIPDEESVPAIPDEESVAATPDEEALTARLCHAAMRQLGVAIELTHEAIARSLAAGANILTRDNFADAYAARTGSDAANNPFMVRDWTGIDCSAVLRRDRDAQPVTPEPANDGPR